MLGFVVGLRNTMLDAFTALVDADAGAGEIRIYDGTRPATGGAATTLLATLPFSTTSFPGAAAGTMSANAITDETSAAAGTATWFRVTDNSGDFVTDGDVGTSGADLNLNTVTFGAGARVEVTSFGLTAPNA